MGPDQYGLARFAVGICVCRATCPQAALRRARRHNAGFRRRNGAAVCAVALGVRRAAAQNQRTDLQADARVVPLAMALNLNDDATPWPPAVCASPRSGSWRGGAPPALAAASPRCRMLQSICRRCCACCAPCHALIAPLTSLGCRRWITPDAVPETVASPYVPRRDGQERSFGQFAFM